MMSNVPQVQDLLLILPLDIEHNDKEVHCWNVNVSSAGEKTVYASSDIALIMSIRLIV